MQGNSDDRLTVIVDTTGQPVAVIDEKHAVADALILALQVAAADNSAEVDRLIAKWAEQSHPAYFAKVLREALRILAANIVAPLVRAVERSDPSENPRRALADQRDAAVELYGR